MEFSSYGSQIMTVMSARLPLTFGRRTAFGLCTGALAGSALAQSSSPDAFLAAIYRPYLAKDFPGQPYGEAERFFVPALARAMAADNARAARRGEVPRLNGDPFVDAQEWQVTNLAISVAASGATATGTVTFTNLGQAKKLLVDLEQTPAGWRIADIRGPNGALSALYRTR